jgi:hypothetical protein
MLLVSLSAKLLSTFYYSMAVIMSLTYERDVKRHYVMT